MELLYASPFKRINVQVKQDYRHISQHPSCSIVEMVDRVTKELSDTGTGSDVKVIMEGSQKSYVRDKLREGRRHLMERSKTRF